jgi:hypothetical protein
LKIFPGEAAEAASPAGSGTVPYGKSTPPYAASFTVILHIKTALQLGYQGGLYVYYTIVSEDMEERMLITKKRDCLTKCSHFFWGGGT